MSEPFISYHDEFQAVTGNAPRLERVVETDAHEGLVYLADEDALYFTTLPQPVVDPLPGFRTVAIRRVQLDGDRFPIKPEKVTVVQPEANMANGMTVDNNGNLIICEQGSRAEHARIGCLNRESGEVELVVDQWRGLRFNSPNDVVAKRDGTIWFTDPTYGHLQGFKPEPLLGDYVYRYDPQNDRLAVVEDSFNKPNGLAFSPDESLLYITDSGANQEEGSYYVHLPHHIRAFDVVEGRHLRNGRLFAVTAPGFPDGIKVDPAGRVYTSAFGGVQVFSPLGDLIGEIQLPGAVNFTFGGPENNILFIAADTAIWAAKLKAVGV